MAENSTRSELFELFSDRRTIRILHETDESPRSVQQLADICDVSGPTVYRHVNTLLDHDLLTQETKIDTKGNHYTVYKNNVKTVDISISPPADEITVDLNFCDSVDRFQQLWEDMKHES